MARVALMCVWLCCASTVAGRAQPAPVPTAAAYANALGQVQAALEQQGARLAHAPAAAKDVVPVESVARRALSSFTVVAGPGSAVQPINNSVLESTLHQIAALPNALARGAAYAQAAAQIARLRADVVDTGTGASPVAAQASVRAVLGRAEFDSDPLPPPSLWDRFVAWLDKLFSRKHTPTPTLSPISPVFIKTLLIIVAAGAFALLVSVLVQYLRGRARPAGALSLSEEEQALVEARDAASLRALAEEQARRGEWRAAFRLTYLAALVALDTHGTLRFDRSKTNWEYLRALRAAGQSDTYAALLPLTREFDRIWYGGARAEASDYAYAVAQYDALAPASSLASSS